MEARREEGHERWDEVMEGGKDGEDREREKVGTGRGSGKGDGRSWSLPYLSQGRTNFNFCKKRTKTRNFDDYTIIFLPIREREKKSKRTS